MPGRVGAFLLAALAPVALLVVDPAGWYPFGAPAWLAVATLLPAGAALVLARRPVRLAPVPTAAAGLLVMAMAVAAVAGFDRLYAWTGTPERHLGVWTWVLLALALVAGQALGPAIPGARGSAGGDGTTMAAGLVLAGLGLGLVATAEALGWEPAVLEVTPGRLTATLGSAAYLGAAAALLLPALVGVAADRAMPGRLRVPAGVGAGLLVVAVAGAGARSAWVGLVVAGLVTAWVRRRWLAARSGRVASGAALGAAALVALVVLTPVGPRLASVADAGEPGGRGRLDEWRVATRVVADHPVLGVGPEGYRIAFGGAVDARYERAHGRDPQPDRAHSSPLDVALAGGLPALAAWSVAVGAMLAAAARALGGSRPWLAGVGAGVVAHHAGSLLLFPTMELDPLAWLLGGLLLAAPASVRGGARLACRPAHRRGGGGGWGHRERVVPRPVLVGLAVLAAAGLVAGTTEVVAERRAGAAVDALARADLAAAEQAVDAATGLRPDLVRHHLLAARIRVAADRGTLAGLAAVDDALAVSPGDPIARRTRAGLLVERARATGVPDHAAAARAEIDRLLADDPVSAALWLDAGSAALLDGDEEAARRAWERAEDLAPRSPAPSVNLALLHLGAGRLDDAGAAAARALARAPTNPAVAAVADQVRSAGRSPG